MPKFENVVFCCTSLGSFCSGLTNELIINLTEGLWLGIISTNYLFEVFSYLLEFSHKVDVNLKFKSKNPLFRPTSLGYFFYNDLKN